VHARFAEALHGNEANHDARPLNSGLITASAAVTIAPAARREIDALLTPFPCQCADVFGRNAGFLFLPLWRFRDAVLFAEQLGFPLVEAHRVRLDIISVLQAFLDPHI